MNQATAPTAPPDALSPEQWQGLARLADLVNAVSGPFAGPMTGALDRTLGMANRHDIGDLAEAVLDTAEALRASGLLALLRDNADLLAQSIRLLVPLLARLPETLNGLPLEELKQDVERLHRLMDKTDLLGEYVAEYFAGPAVRMSVDAADFARREALGESLRDLLQTLGHLHRNGSLAWLRDISDYLEDREQQRLLGSLAGQGIDGAASLTARTHKLLRGVQSAMDDAAADADQLGGVKGLLHLLRDADVQRGLRALAVLPAYLEDGNTP
jgi:hypothetical protein